MTSKGQHWYTSYKEDTVAETSAIIPGDEENKPLTIRINLSPDRNVSPTSAEIVIL